MFREIKSGKEHPFFAKGIIPKGTYESAAAARSTLTLWNFMATYAGLPADFVYEFKKQIFLGCTPVYSKRLRSTRVAPQLPASSPASRKEATSGRRLKMECTVRRKAPVPFP